MDDFVFCHSTACWKDSEEEIVGLVKESLAWLDLRNNFSLPVNYR